MKQTYNHALIIGAGAGLSAALARKCAAQGMRVDLAARDIGDLAALCAETGATAHTCDAAKLDDIRALFATVGAPDVLIYNPSRRVPGSLTELDPTEVAAAIEVTATGAFYAAQEAAKRMLPEKRGAILLTGATAGVKSFARSTAFAMGKFALRGMAQSLARELAPQGIHVAHFVIDGGIRSVERGRVEGADNPDSWLDPDAIAESYLHVLDQDRSVWSWEMELRPWVERF